MDGPHARSIRRRMRGGPLFRVAPFLLLSLVIILTLAFVSACGSSGAAPDGSADPGGPAAPDFAGTTLEGQGVSLSLYRGKPLVLAFTASW